MSYIIKYKFVFNHVQKCPIIMWIQYNIVQPINVNKHILYPKVLHELHEINRVIILWRRLFTRVVTKVFSK